MIYTVTLEDMEFKAFHGCYELEKVVGNRFLVTVALDAELGDAAVADDVTRTVNYLEVYETVAAQMKIKSDIIENVAHRIGEAIHSRFPAVVRSSVTVSKLAPPLGGKIRKVSATLVK